MTFSFFALAALALFLTHWLTQPARAKGWLAMTAFLAGFISVVLLVRGFAVMQDIGRTTDFDRVVNAALLEAQQDPAPLIVFTGASYSRNAIDPARLTLAFKEAGYNYRVVNLSLEAASIFERDQHLRQFSRLSARTPELVFVEVAEAFDTKAAFMFANSKFNARAIEQFDILTSWRTAQGVAEGACYGLVDCVKDVGFLGLHLAMNTLNIGLIGRGETPLNASALAAWDPQYESREDVDTAPLRIEGVSERAVPNWVAHYRRAMRTHWLQVGVRQMAYYQPPVIAPTERAYLSKLCRTELADQVCFAVDDARLRRALDADVWLDASHLLEPGAAIYNRWLADEILASGLLEAPE